MPNPFGETPAPWWRRIWRGERPESAPKRYTVPAGAVGPLAALLLPNWHTTDEATKAVLVGVLLALFLGPPALVETWWRARRRRASERLTLSTEDDPAR
jgi:hypothetical protein